MQKLLAGSALALTLLCLTAPRAEAVGQLIAGVGTGSTSCPVTTVTNAGLGAPPSITSQGAVCIAGNITVSLGGTTSNASSGVATSSTNNPSVSYNYGFNGTTWDQLQVDGSKNLTVVEGAALPAGTNFIGQIGGQDTVASVSMALQNASYVSGNCITGFQTLSVARVSGGSGILNYVNLISSGGLVTGKQIYVFDQNPAGSTCTDKGTFSIATADYPKLIATFSLTPALPTGSTWSEAEQTVMAKSFVTSGNANLYVAVVEQATETPAAASTLQLTLGASQN